MRVQTVDVRQAHGRVLCTAIFRPGGKKLLSRGHVLTVEDLRMLETEGLRTVWVTELEQDEVAEDQAVLEVGSTLGCGSVEVRLAAGGRANLIATEDVCVIVDDDLLREVNCTSSVVIATTPNFSYARAGDRIATVKSAPFAVSRQELEVTLGVLADRGPILQARPVRNPVVAVLYSDHYDGERARSLFENFVRQRLARFGTAPRYTLACTETEAEAVKALGHLLRMQPTVVLVASTTAPAGPEDAIGRAMKRLGASIERFLAPVEPGNLLMLGYSEAIPIVSAPGCYRSAKPNVVDLLLPPLLACYRVTGWEIASMGHGGLLA